MSDEKTKTHAEKLGSELVPVPVDGAAELATPDEAAAFQVRFVRLLERRTAIYTMGDSTSVPKYVAANLLRSICFVLGIDPDRPEIPRRLLTVDLEEEYNRRLADIERRLTATEQLWRDVCATMPLIDNIALRDTLNNLGDFFKWYDYRSMAHEIPVMIDYLLCHPVPEELQGIDYIEEYLRRLMIEAEFLAKFEIKAIRRVLRASSPDHVELLINFCEPVAVNAIGLALIGRDSADLEITEASLKAIGQLLRTLTRAERQRALLEAAAAVCATVDFQGEDASRYLCDAVRELAPRVEIALMHGDLRGVFARTRT